jgi:hypothetical protein
MTSQWVHVLLAVTLLFSACAGVIVSKSSTEATVIPVSKHGLAYHLLAKFAIAVHYKNWTLAASLLANAGAFEITDYSCGKMNKGQFLDVLLNEHVRCSQMTLGSFVETADGVTIVRAEIGAMFDGKATLPNASYFNPSVYIALAPTLDGTQIAWLQRWTDRTWQQANSSAMLATWNSLRAASELGTVDPWRSLITPDFTFSMFYAFDQYPSYTTNATIFLDELSHSYRNQRSAMIQVVNAFPVCDYIVAETTVFVDRIRGGPIVQKFFLSLKLDWLMRVERLQQFAVGFF